MIREVTETCVRCETGFTYTYRGNGPYRKLCGSADCNREQNTKNRRRAREYQDNPPEYPWKLAPESLSIAEASRLAATTKDAALHVRPRRKPSPVDLLESGASPETVEAAREAAEGADQPGTTLDLSSWDTEPLSVLAGLTPDDRLYGLPEILATLGLTSSGRWSDVGPKAALDDWFRKSRDKIPYRLIPMAKRKDVRDWFARNAVEVAGATLDVQRDSNEYTPLLGSSRLPGADTWTRPKTPPRCDPVPGFARGYMTDLSEGAKASLAKPVRAWPFDDLIEYGIYTGCPVARLPRLEPFTTLFG